MKKLIMFALTALVSLPATNKAEPALNAEAPAFSLKDTKGSEVALSQFKGKYVVLEWINHDCPFVKKHYESGNMQSLQKNWTGKDVVWLSICSSAPGRQGHYAGPDFDKLTAEKGAAPTAVLLDESGEAGRAYAAKTTPHMFVVNPEGVLIYMGAIDDTASAEAEDTKTAVNYVSKTLEAAIAGLPVDPASTKPYGCSVKYAP